MPATASRVDTKSYNALIERMIEIGRLISRNQTEREQRRRKKWRLSRPEPHPAAARIPFPEFDWPEVRLWHGPGVARAERAG